MSRESMTPMPPFNAFRRLNESGHPFSKDRTSDFGDCISDTNFIHLYRQSYSIASTIGI